MPKTHEFKQEQRGVALAMASALVAAIVALSSAALVDRAAVAAPFAARLQFALRADLFVIVWFAATIANLARLRFFSEHDIAGSSAEAGSTEVRQAGAILQNTFEQAGLAIVTHLIVAATFTRSAAVIKVLVCMFAMGRLLFWAGYRYGAKGRAFGFALTFYPSVLALVASVIGVLLEWLT
jgi:uncharacterized membrane protein YecN with MAPEG domain